MAHYFKTYTQHYQGFTLAVWLNIIAVFTITAGFVTGTFFTLYLLNFRHFNIHLTVLALVVNGIGGVLGSFMSGRLIDFIHPAQVAKISLIIFALSLFGFVLFVQIPLILLLTFINGLSFGSFRPANNMVLFTHCEKHERTQVMALYRVAFNLGLAFSNGIGGIIASISFNWFFLFSGVMATIAGLLLIAFHRVLSAKNFLKEDEAGAPHTLKDFFKNRPFIVLTFLFLLHCLIFFQVRAMFAVYLSETYHLSLRTMSDIFMINFFLIVFFEVPLMGVLKKFNQIKLVMWGNLLIGLSFFILPFGRHADMAALSTLMWTIGEILATSPFFVLALHFAHQKAPGFYMGVFQGVLGVAMVLAPVAGGTLYVFLKGNLLWYGCGVLSVLMMAGFIRLNHYRF